VLAHRRLDSSGLAQPQVLLRIGDRLMPVTDELAHFASDLQLMRDRAIRLHVDAIDKYLDWAIWVVRCEIVQVTGCPNCNSGNFEVYETSLEGQGWICRVCNHTYFLGRGGTPQSVSKLRVCNSRWFSRRSRTPRPVSTLGLRSTQPYSERASCPNCGSTEFEMRTYGGSWDDADTHCAKCGKLVQSAWEM